MNCSFKSIVSCSVIRSDSEEVIDDNVLTVFLTAVNIFDKQNFNFFKNDGTSKIQSLFNSTFASVLHIWVAFGTVLSIIGCNECGYAVVLSLSILTAITPGEPGLAGFIAAKDDGCGSDNWSF